MGTMFSQNPCAEYLFLMRVRGIISILLSEPSYIHDAMMHMQALPADHTGHNYGFHLFLF
jgi:hypothetical protein